MKNSIHKLTVIVLMLAAWLVWWWAYRQTFSYTTNLIVMIGSLVLVIPVSWVGRLILDRNPTAQNAVRVTTFAHGVGILFGVSIIRALLTHADWSGWTLPIPTEVGLVLIVLTGVPLGMSVVNLALKGLGAPFAIALSQQLAVEWMYAWTRNPMILSALAFLVALGIWFQSGLFVLWALLLFAPAILFFVKVYEERELALRFGQSYLDYKAKTPMLIPRKPRA